MIRAIRGAAGREAVAGLAERAGRSRRRTDAVIGRLEELGLARVDPDGTVGPGPDGPPAASAAPSVVAAQERRRAVERSRVEMVRGYAETGGCRRAFLLGYFGEPFDPPCGNCDRCLAGLVPARVPSPTDEAPFGVNDRVRHATFGPGIVTGLEGGKVTVAFDAVGYRTLSLEEVVARGLLVAGGP